MAEITGVMLGPQALDQVRAVVRRVLGEPLAGPSGKRARGTSQSGAPIVFKNTSGETCPARAIMRIASVALEDERVVYSIGKPNATFQRQYLVNLSQDIEDTDYGAATWLSDAGYFLAEGSPALGDSYGAKSGQWSAVKNRNGFEILGGTTGSGSTQAVYGRQQIVNSLIGKPVSSITKGSPGTAKIWFRNSSSGTREAAEFDAISVSALMAAVTGGGSAKYCGITWDAGQWVITPGEC